MENLVTRKQWGARSPRSTTPLGVERVDYLVVHYSASQYDEADDHHNCASRVRGIQNFHMDAPDHGWADIAYHWLVCRHGYIFRGRGLGVMGAATLHNNSHTVAVCFLGNDTPHKADVTAEAKEAIREVHAFVKRNCPNLKGVKGHRDFTSTDCPGDELYGMLKTL